MLRSMAERKSNAGQSWFTMPYQLKEIPIKGDTNVRYPEAFVRKFINEYTKERDKVLDPFAGYGTTLAVAQKMGRIGIGIEYDQKKCRHIETLIQPPSKLIHGDARKLSAYDIPKCDFSITSPPYMQAHHKEHPLTNYKEKGDYTTYLKEMKKVYAQVKNIMKRNALIVLEVSNIRGGKRPMTPLAWDIAKTLSDILFFEREIVYCHTNSDPDSIFGNHSYCLLFRNK